jgi:hypothetical protein
MDMSVAGLAYAFEPSRQNREPEAYQSWLDQMEALNGSVAIVVVATFVSWIGRALASLRRMDGRTLPAALRLIPSIVSTGAAGDDRHERQ